MVMQAASAQDEAVSKAVEVTKKVVSIEERRDIMKLYRTSIEVKDEKLAELVGEYTEIRQKLNGKAGEAKKLMNELTELAAKLQVESSELNGQLKYVEEKIVQRHHQIS